MQLWFNCYLWRLLINGHLAGQRIFLETLFCPIQIVIQQHDIKLRLVSLSPPFVLICKLDKKVASEASRNTSAPLEGQKETLSKIYSVISLEILFLYLYLLKSIFKSNQNPLTEMSFKRTVMSTAIESKIRGPPFEQESSEYYYFCHSI